jgi:hypothetical protein
MFPPASLANDLLSEKTGVHPLNSISASLPFDHVAIDLKQLPTSPEGYNYILLLVDIYCLSKIS